MQAPEKNRPNFSRLGFILATVGSAVGLGNIWKFPYITYANEGGTFVLVYLLAILLIGGPMMMAETLIGRRGKKNVVDSFSEMAKGGSWWSLVGWLALIAMVFTMFYYAVAGWTLYYFWRCLLWSINGFSLNGPELAQEFGAYLSNGWLQVIFTFLFVLLTMSVVSFQLKRGIERIAKILMPTLAALLILFLLAAMTTPGFTQAVRFLFHFDTISSDGILEAIGHSFFTLGLGAGIIITLGSYFSDNQSIIRTAAAIVFFDTLVGLVACLIMFSIIFSVPEAERAESFSQSAVILFTTLPSLLYELPFGVVLAPLFYLTITFAALTTTVAASEVAVTFLVDRLGWRRPVAAFATMLLILGVSISASLSLGGSAALSTWAPLGERAVGVFGVLDYLATNWLVVLGGLFTAVFLGWFADQRLVLAELEKGHGRFRYFKIWQFALRFIIPMAILWIVVAVIGGRTF